MCSILTADVSVDPVKYFNRAFEHYSKLRGRQGRMLATRVMMTAAAYQAALGRWVGFERVDQMFGLQTNLCSYQGTR